jgi:hypothetical protein
MAPMPDGLKVFLKAFVLIMIGTLICRFSESRSPVTVPTSRSITHVDTLICATSKNDYGVEVFTCMPVHL